MHTGGVDSDGEHICAHIPAPDVERLDRMAERRGVEREVLIAQAVDAMLAKEAWNGGFIRPPEPMHVPGPFIGRSNPTKWWRWGKSD